MPQVSKIPVQKEIENRMFSIFWETLADLSTPAMVEKFLSDLLSKTEKTMLAKRLAIAILLTKKFDYASISGILKVSSGTISSVASWLTKGGEGYKMVIEKILTQEKFRNFFEEFDHFLYKYGSAKRFFVPEEETRAYWRKGKKPKLPL